MAVQKVNGQSLVDLENELSTRFDSVKAQLKTLQGTINSLEGAWQGIGARAFDTKQREVNGHMEKIAHLLLTFQEAMKATRTLSGNTEDEVRQALQGIDVVGGHSGDAAATARATSNLSTY